MSPLSKYSIIRSIKKRHRRRHRRRHYHLLCHHHHHHHHLYLHHYLHHHHQQQQQQKWMKIKGREESTSNQKQHSHTILKVLPNVGRHAYTALSTRLAGEDRSRWPVSGSEACRRYPCCLAQGWVLFKKKSVLSDGAVAVAVVLWGHSGRLRPGLKLLLLLLLVIIIIALKGAIRDFLQSSHSAANCLQRVRSSGPGAIVWKSRATHRAVITCKRHVTCHLIRRDSSAIKFDRVEIAFIWASFYWLNH